MLYLRKLCHRLSTRPDDHAQALREGPLTTIPKSLHEHINTAYPAHVCLISTTLPNGYAQITPRGSTMVFDDKHFALWERGRGSTNANLADGTKVTVFFRKPPLRESGLLPRGGTAPLSGTPENPNARPHYKGNLDGPTHPRQKK